MPIVPIVSVSSFSTESTEHRAENILRTTSRSWRCSRKESSLGRAVITLKLESPCLIQFMDILNAGSAFVQVDGIEEDISSSSTVPLLPMKTLMNDKESRVLNSAAHTQCYMYKTTDFAPESRIPFMYLQFTLTQPFKLGVPFGLTAVTVRSPSTLSTRRLSALSDKPPSLTDPEKNLTFSFMSKPPSPNKKLLGLNDAAAAEDFELKKGGPMARLLTKESPSTISTRNSYFATINEKHDFTYKTPCAKTTPRSRRGSDAVIVTDDLSDDDKGTPKSVKDKRRKKPELQFSSNKENISCNEGLTVEVQVHNPTRKRTRKKSLTFDNNNSIPIPTAPSAKAERKLRKMSDEDSLPDISIINNDISPNKNSAMSPDKHSTVSPLWYDCSFKMPGPGDSIPAVRSSGSVRRRKSSKSRRLDFRPEPPKENSFNIKNKAKDVFKKKSVSKSSKEAPIDIGDDVLDDVLICESIEISKGAMSECPVCGTFIDSDLIQRHANSCLDFVNS